MLILIVDDLPDTREVMGLLLNLKGHEVVEAANGQEAIDQAKAHFPDLILLDVSMPVMDGLAAARHIRQEEATRTIPIVALSSRMSEAAWRKKAIESGCSYCWQKPLDVELLDTMLARLQQSRA